MFKLANKNTIERPILKCDYIRHSPESSSIFNDENKQSYIDIHEEHSALSLKDTHLELEFDVKLKAADNILYADKTYIRSVNFGPTA